MNIFKQKQKITKQYLIKNKYKWKFKRSIQTIHTNSQFFLLLLQEYYPLSSEIHLFILLFTGITCPTANQSK